jgi:hypothetical protein
MRQLAELSHWFQWLAPDGDSATAAKPVHGGARRPVAAWRPGGELTRADDAGRRRGGCA